MRPCSVLLLATLFGCRPPVESASDEADADRAAVESLLEQVLERFAAGDAEGLLSLYAPGFVGMFPEHRNDLGWEDTLAYYRELFESVTPRNFTASSRTIEVENERAFARITYEGELVPRAGGEARSVTSRHITILQRGPEGDWKVLWDIFNLP